jgi:hypothetical protein
MCFVVSHTWTAVCFLTSKLVSEKIAVDGHSTLQYLADVITSFTNTHISFHWLKKLYMKHTRLYDTKSDVPLWNSNYNTKGNCSSYISTVDEPDQLTI